MANSKNTSSKTESGKVSVTFVDKAFRSRTLVLEDGRTFVVENSRILADDPLLIAHLDKHADFERVSVDNTVGAGQ